VIISTSPPFNYKPIILVVKNYTIIANFWFFNESTTFIIEKLQDSWSDAAITRAYKYTENLLLPEPLSEERKAWDAKRYDPGFKAYLYRDKISEETIVINL
jgi:hypothetical protein